MKNKNKKWNGRYFVLLLAVCLLAVESGTLTGLFIFESGSSSVEPDYFSNLEEKLSENANSVMRNLNSVFEYFSYYWLFVIIAAGMFFSKRGI